MGQPDIYKNCITFLPQLHPGSDVHEGPKALEKGPILIYLQVRLLVQNLETLTWQFTRAVEVNRKLPNSKQLCYVASHLFMAYYFYIEIFPTFFYSLFKLGLRKYSEIFSVPRDVKSHGPLKF